MSCYQATLSPFAIRNHGVERVLEKCQVKENVWLTLKKVTIASVQERAD